MATSTHELTVGAQREGPKAAQPAMVAPTEPTNATLINLDMRLRSSRRASRRVAAWSPAKVLALVEIGLKASSG